MESIVQLYGDNKIHFVQYKWHAGLCWWHDQLLPFVESFFDTHSYNKKVALVVWLWRVAPKYMRLLFFIFVMVQDHY